MFSEHENYLFLYTTEREREGDIHVHVYSNLCIVNRHQTPFYKMHWYVNRNRTLLISTTYPLEIIPYLVMASSVSGIVEE